MKSVFGAILMIGMVGAIAPPVESAIVEQQKKEPKKKSGCKFFGTILKCQ